MNWKNWKLWFTLPSFRAVVAEVLISIVFFAVGFGVGWWYKKKKGM